MVKTFDPPIISVENRSSNLIIFASHIQILSRENILLCLRILGGKRTAAHGFEFEQLLGHICLCDELAAAL
jgi:hypothetical protein